MANTFEARVEEVLGVLHGMAWPVLDEADKRKIVGKVVQGIDRYGDTQAMWVRALRVSQATLSERITHFRSSEPIDGSARNTDSDLNRSKAIRHAKSVLRDPAAAAEVMASLKPTEREAVFEAAAASLSKTTDSPKVELPEMDPWFEGIQTLGLSRRSIKRAAPLLDRARITEGRQEELGETVAEIIADLRKLQTRQGRADLRLVVAS